MYQRDYNFGKEQEAKIKPLLEAFFNDKLEASTARYCKYDFKGETCVYEVKSRNNECSKYPTTMTPADKIVDNLIMVFNFTDGLFYIKYEKEVFDTFEKKPFRRYRTDVRDKEKDYIFIPVSKLTKIN